MADVGLERGDLNGDRLAVAAAGRDRFAGYARRLVPDVDVRVLRPGEAATFEFD